MTKRRSGRVMAGGSRIAILLAALAACGGAPRSPSSVVPSPATDSVTLPGLFSRQHIFLRAVVGDVPALLLFDSGASATILSPRLVQRLALPYRGRYMAFGIGEPVTGASTYDGPEIRIGPVRVAPARVLSWPNASFPTYLGTMPDGVIGHDLLRRYVLTIDMLNQLVLAHDTAATTTLERAGSAIPLRVTNGLPVVTVDVYAGGRSLPPSPVATSLPLVVDFGAGAGVQLTRAASQQIDVPARLRDTRVRQIIGIGGSIDVPEGFADSVRIAGATIPDPVVASDTTQTPSVALADAEGLMGTEVLRRFVVTLDYARQRAHFAPNALLRTPFCRNLAGICVRIDAGMRGAEVAYVDPGSPAARAGIRPRYLLVAVDGVPVAQLRAMDIDRLLDRGPGAALEIIRTGGMRTTGRSESAPTRRASVRSPSRDRTSEIVRLPP